LTEKNIIVGVQRFIKSLGYESIVHRAAISVSVALAGYPRQCLCIEKPVGDEVFEANYCQVK
jgi:hypothetical protein